MKLFKRKADTPTQLTVDQVKAEITVDVQRQIADLVRRRTFYGDLSDGGRYEIKMPEVEWSGSGLTITKWDVDWGSRS